MKEPHHLAKSSVATLVFGVSVFIVWAALPSLGQNAAATPRSVWDGVFSAEQAARGAVEFQEHCSSCHGPDLQGSADAKALKGDRFWTDWKESTVDYLLERISKSMPFSEDGSLAGTLSQQTYVDVVTHILNVNGFPAGQKELSPESSAGVQIIRKEGPGELPSGTLIRVVGCLAKATDGSWRLMKATAPVRTRAGAAATSATVPTASREYTLKFALTPLDKFVGHRLAVTGLLIGEGGKEGVNLSSTTSLATTCE